MRALITAVLLAAGAVRAGTLERAGDELTVRGTHYAVAVDLVRKAVSRASVDGADVGLGFRSLWSARFRGGAVETSADAELVGTSVDGDTATLTFRGEKTDVALRLRAGDEALDLSAEVEVRDGELLALAVPDEIEFAVVRDGSFVCQARGRSNCGLKLKAPFFGRREVWAQEGASPAFGRALLGGVEQLDRADAPRVGTVPGRDFWKFLSPAQYAAAANDKGLKGVSIRPLWPFPADKLDLELLKDEKGDVVLGGSRCGGTDGVLLRFGGLVQGQVPVGNAVRTLGTIALNRTTAVRGVIALVAGVDTMRPPFTISIANWQKEFAAVGVKPKLVKTPDELVKAMADPATAVIVNPYADSCMTPADMTMETFCGKVREFVRAGGCWMEINGRDSFSRRLVRKPGFRELDWAHVPHSFADFFALDSGRGPSAKVAFGSVQPEVGEPFDGLTNRWARYTPTHALVRGAEAGGRLDRRFLAYAKAGGRWASPVTRFWFGLDAYAGAAAFCRDNGWDRPLADRYEAKFLKRVLERPLVLAGDGGCETYRRNVYKLGILPPCLFHLCNYTHGDFDKQYPDFLPPIPRWGTEAEFARLYVDARANGSILVPYTNPTFWCDLPQGATFRGAGRAPLQRNLDGKEVWEIWNGWATCLWHPAVRAANDRNVRLFTEIHPTEILFQDQVAARGLSGGANDYDFNPASPAPDARVAGFIAQARRDDRRAGNDHALATEDMGAPFMTHFIFGAGNDTSEAALLEWYPRETFELFNFIGLLSHDKTEMFDHPDASVDTDARLAKTLGLGNGVVYVAKVGMTGGDIDWARWLAEIQRRVVARHVGRPMRDFRHRWSDRADSLGVLEAEYGDVGVVANLQPKPLRIDGFCTLADCGYRAESADGRIRLGLVSRLGPFGGRNAYLMDGDELFLFASPGQKAMFPAGADVRDVLLDGASLRPDLRDGAGQVVLPKRLYEGWPHLWRLRVKRK